jgi:DNA (cytosine-5)-methyltransferase 1
MFTDGISLFSGAGGDTIGLTNSGVNVIGYSEYIDTFIETHKANHPKCKLIGKDIRQIKNETFEEYKNKIGILFAGFPCQTFSHGGKKAALSDPRGNLFYDFVRAADVMKPRWIIGENVKGILSRKNEDKSKFVKDIICEEFEKIGYHMYEPFVLKASDFGVPQKRERCFFVGSLKKHDFTSSWFEQHKAKEVGLKDIVRFSLERALLIQKHDELDDTYENLRDQRLAANKELKKKLPKHRKIIKIILNYTYPLCAEIESLIKDMNDTSEPTESPPTMLKKCFEKKDKHGLSFRTRSSGTFSEIVDIELPTKTILCTYGRMARLYVPICNKIGIYLRPFTIPELLQIQDFPSDYDLKGGYLQQVTQIGNAVPPKLVEIVMKQIKELDNFESIKTIKPIITNEKETYTNDDLQKLIIAQLKDICRKHKEWKRWSKLKKQELIEFIIKNNKN